MPVPLAAAHPWRDLERHKNECPVRLGDQRTGAAHALCFPFPCTGTNHTSSFIFLTKLLQHHPKLLSESSHWGALFVFSLAGGSFQEGIFAGCSSSLPKLHVGECSSSQSCTADPKTGAFGEVAPSCWIRPGMARGITCSLTAVPRKVGCPCLPVTRQDTGSSPAPAREGFDFSKISKYLPVGVKLTFNVLWRHQAVHAFPPLF